MLLVAVALLVARPAMAEDDPYDVNIQRQHLDELQGFLDQDGETLLRYPAVASGVWAALHEPTSDDIRRSPKLAAMKARLHALDLRLVDMAGERARDIYGDGRRVATAKKLAIEEIGGALGYCRGRRPQSIVEGHARWLAKVERAKQIDPAITSYRGQIGGGHYDVKLELVLCEYLTTKARLAVDDEYQPESLKAQSRKGCGKRTFLAAGVQIEGGKFAPYRLVDGSATVPVKIACGAVPRASKLPKDLATAAAQLKKQERYRVVTFALDGEAYVEEQRGRLYQYQSVVAYSPEMVFGMNPCGDEKTICEQTPSKSIAHYNEMAHHARRAQLHKDARRLEYCRASLKAAFTAFEALTDFVDGAKQSGAWIAGLKYRIRGGQILTEAAFLDRARKEGKLIEARRLADDCAKR